MSRSITLLILLIPQQVTRSPLFPKRGIPVDFEGWIY